MLKPLITKHSALAALSILSLSVAGCNSGSNAGGAAGGAEGATGAALDTAAVVAKVGSEDISRGEIYSFLEANAGEAALRQLIDYHLVMQAAKAKNIDITDKEVEDELARRQESSPDVAKIVEAKGQRLEAYKQQLRSQMAIERLLTNDIKAEPAAVEKWLASPDPSDPSKKAKNRARYDRPAQVKIGLLLTSTKARADLMASQLKGSKSFSDLVKEQKEANDPVAKQSFASSVEAPSLGGGGGYIPADRLPFVPAASAQVKKLQVNQTSGVLTLSPPGTKSPILGIVQMLDRRAESKASASDPSVLMDYKLTQVAQNVLKESSKTSPTKVTLAQVIPQIMQSAMQQGMQTGNFVQPTYRQALDQINQSEVGTMLSKLRTSATSGVSIPDKQYATLLEAYKPAPTPPPLPSMAPAASGAPAAGGASAGGASTSGASTGASPAASKAPAAGASPAASKAPAAGAAR